MKIGHILLSPIPDDDAEHFLTLVKGLDKLAVDQHVLVTNAALARDLHSCPYVVVGPLVRTPVVAYCLMPEVDLVHIHDYRGGQAGLLMTLTRSTPFVMTAEEDQANSSNPIRRSMFQRAQALISSTVTDPEEVVAIYRTTIGAWSKFPQDANCG